MCVPKIIKRKKEKSLGDAVHGFIVWRKRYIMISGMPRAPSPP